MVDGLTNFNDLESLFLIVGHLANKSWAETLDSNDRVVLFDYFTKPAYEWPPVKYMSREKYEEMTTEVFRRFGYPADMERFREEDISLMRVIRNLAAHNLAWKAPQVEIEGIRVT